MNRIRYRPRIIGSFMCGDQPACEFILRVSSAREGMPAFHNFCSVLWEVHKGRSWVVYQQKDGDWVLGYLFEGEQWSSYIDQPYFFLPVEEDLFLVGITFEEQLRPEELKYPEIKRPEEAFVHFNAEVVATGDEWIELYNGSATSKVFWPDDRLEELAEVSTGATESFRYEVDINEYIAWAEDPENEIEFDPRIIERNKLVAGSYGWELETVRAEEYSEKLRATSRTPEYLLHNSKSSPE